MHWWQGAFASSSKSNSSTALDDGNIRHSSRRRGFFSSRRSRQLQRAQKVRFIAGDDANPLATVASQPLPMPKLEVLLQRDENFTRKRTPVKLSPNGVPNSTYSMPLPSPSKRDVVNKVKRDKGAYEARDIDAIVDEDEGLNVLRRVSQDQRATAERPETLASKRSPQRRNTKSRSSENISMPNSSPSSPRSSPIPSPQRNEFLSTPYTTDIFQNWSAPEFPPSSLFQNWSCPEISNPDRNIGPYLYYPFPYEKTASSGDSSPLQSPRLSSHSHTSPLSSKLSSDLPVGRWESSVLATVHPLPLPPVAASPLSPGISGASIPSPSTPTTLNAAKPDFGGAKSAPKSPAAKKSFKSRWQKGKMIGRGTFGSVYVASNRETGALCAMKEVEILQDDSKSAESIRQLEQEIKFLSHLKHPNIVQYYGSEVVGDKFYIYLEYVHPGSINKFIQDHFGAITESVVRNFTRHILCGLAYLHRKKTVHRDIKGANLLVDAYGVVKLADFGMAKHLDGQAANLSLKGSPYWLAPEILQPTMHKDAISDHALAVDIWSLGCTIIEMMDGKPPWSEYEGAAALFKVLQETPPIPETMSPEGKDFLQCCFHRNPANRPTAKTLLDHPFLSNSSQLEVCNQSMKEMRLSDPIQLPRDRLKHKKGNLENNEINQVKNHQTPRLTLAATPRSTFDPTPTTVSPGYSSPSTPPIYQKRS